MGWKVRREISDNTHFCFWFAFYWHLIAIKFLELLWCLNIISFQIYYLLSSFYHTVVFLYFVYCCFCWLNLFNTVQFVICLFLVVSMLLESCKKKSTNLTLCSLIIAYHQVLHSNVTIFEYLSWLCSCWDIQIYFYFSVWTHSISHY